MAQTASNAAKAVLMPMRLKIPNDFPNIGKFSDTIEWNQLGAPKMYFKEEELKEEEVGEVVKDAEYYKKRRNQRRSYRKKNLLLFEDETYPLPGGLKYNGQLANTTLAELEATQLNKHSAIEDEAPFKYALLQFTKKDHGENEINVIPVGDMFLFKKAPKAQDELLADIEARFENERLRVKDRHEKYKGIYNSLVNAEKNRLKAEGADAEEFTGGFESTSLFMKAGFGKKKKSASSLGGGTQTYINENGIDVDELKEHDWCQGDYTTRYADDEEDNVVVEQISNNQYEDQEISASLRYDEEEAPDSDEEQEEDKKDEDEDEEVGMVDESMVSSAAEARKMLNLSNLNKQVQLDKQAQLAAINAAANAAVSAETKDSSSSSSSSGAAAGGSGKTSLKRSRVSFEDSSSAAASIAAATSSDAAASGGNSAAAGTTGVAGDAKKGRASLSASESSSALSSAGSEYNFNEEGVRKFIQHKGGKVTTGVLLEFFKPMIKTYRDDQGKKAGKEKFLGIVKDATVTMEDPVLGTVLTVKQ